YDASGVHHATRDLDALLGWYERQLLAGLVIHIEPYASILERLHERGRSLLSWFPCGAGLSSLGIKPEGSVVACHHFLRDPGPPVGNVRDGLPGFEQRRKLALAITDREPCRSCWARHLCGGECYHRALTAGRGYDGVLTESCHGKREVIARTVELFARVSARRPQSLEDLARRDLTEPAPNWFAYDFQDLSPYGG
ncbi:MAG: SPASM domain-containing protein, partial [Deltaproteobacteria bacterium]|nr:SPASM domain-containing protein [Deltaproteobacteria bacterium]